MDNKKGFTLIELLIVVVIIGILAAIAIPRFGETRERAFKSAVTSDLRNLQTLQEQYYFDEGTYTYANDFGALNFSLSDGVSDPPATFEGDSDGYHIRLTHTGLGNEGCDLQVGQEGQDDGITCDWDNGDGGGT